MSDRTLVPRDTQRLEKIKERIEKITGADVGPEEGLTLLIDYLERAQPAVQAMRAIREALG